MYRWFDYMVGGDVWQWILCNCEELNIHMHKVTGGNFSILHNFYAIGILYNLSITSLLASAH